MKILHVEDNPGDIELFRHSLRAAAIQAELITMMTGPDAIDFIQRDVALASAVELIILDINLPLIGGLEVLKVIRSTEHVALTPVVLLTTSVHEFDVTTAYREGANIYVQKPIAATEFISVIARLLELWFGIALIRPNRLAS